jgi:hypothetical protein
MDVLMMQTADADVYRPMLEVAAEINRLWCARHGAQYESYLGIKRGRAPWMATYNRIFMLEEVLLRGYRGWVIFADADAYVADLDFDLRGYLTANARYCLIGATGGTTDPWNLNAGILFINLGDPIGQEFVRDWRRRFDNLVSESYLNNPESKWDDEPNDQAIMYLCIQRVPGLVERTLREERGVFNYHDGAFMRQTVRARSSSVAERIAWMKADIDRILERGSPDPNDAPLPTIQKFDYVDLTALANRWGSDKGDSIGNSHYYTQFYQFLFEGFRQEAFNFLEIGLLRGGPEVGTHAGRAVSEVPSVSMWLDYFPAAFCHGADISDFSDIKLDRFKFHRINAGAADDLLALRRSLPPLRFIVDDGSHASFHQQLAFAILFPLIEPGGLYIIEDLDWQPQAYEPHLPSCVLTRDLFARFTLDGSLPINPVDESEQRILAQQIKSVRFHRRRGDGITKLVVIEKRG